MNIVRLFVFLFFCFLSFPLHAKINIQESQRLVFPQVERPQSAQETVEVTTGGNVGSSTTASVINYQQANGLYIISSNNNNRKDISININNISTPAGISVDQFIISYKGSSYSNFPVFDLPDPAGGSDLKIGAVISIDSTLQEGDFSFSYDLTVEEQ